MRQTLCVIVLFAISASTLSKTTPKPIPLSWHRCTARHNISEDVLNDLRLNTKNLYQDPTKRCFAACILVENKAVKKDGTVDVVAWTNRIPKDISEPEKITEAINACANKTGVDVCETALKSIKCLGSKGAMVDLLRVRELNRANAVREQLPAVMTSTRAHEFPTSDGPII